MTPDRRLFLLALGSATLPVLTACGGGGSDATPAPATSVTPRETASRRAGTRPSP